MTKNERFRVCIKDNSVSLVDVLDNNARLLFIRFSNKPDARSCESALMHQCMLMNALYDENKDLKQELRGIYDIATLNKAISIINKIYDGYLGKDPENEILSAKIDGIFECLEKLDNFKDDLNIEEY